jgi:hypothetical protein
MLSARLAASSVGLLLAMFICPCTVYGALYICQGDDSLRPERTAEFAHSISFHVTVMTGKYELAFYPHTVQPHNSWLVQGTLKGTTIGDWVRSHSRYRVENLGLYL